MRFEHLESFLAVARLGSVNRAAAVLHRSQPNITRQLQLLERDLAAQLFDRSPRGMTLTAPGRALVPIAESTIAAANDARRCTADAAEGRAGSLSMAAVGTLANADLVAALRTFRVEHPDVTVHVSTAFSNEVSALVRRGDASIGLRYGTDADPRVRSPVIATDPIIAIASTDHPLAGRRRCAVERLAAQQWFTFAAALQLSDEPYTTALQASFGLLGAPRSNIAVADSLSAQKVLVAAGLGLALLPASAAQPELAEGTIVRLHLPFTPPSAPIALITRANAFVSRPEKTLATALRRHYSR